MVEQEGYPVQVVCQILGVARSSYYRPTKAAVDDQALRAAIQRLAARYPTYGSRRITQQLRRAPDEWVVSRKRVQRIMRELHLQGHAPRQRVRTTNSAHGYRRYPNRVTGLTVTRPDQVWVADITYVRLQQDFVYLAVLMDVFTRALRGWHLSQHLDQTLTLRALQMALQKGLPAMHHSDQGIQYAGHVYSRLLRQHRILPSMAATGVPEENGYAERLMRTIKEEEVALSDYRNLHDARAQIGHFLEDVYQTKRIHSALGYLTPAEFEAVWRHDPGRTSPLIIVR